MVTLIIGNKGSGKTKKLVDAANAAAKTVSGNVVVIEPKAKLMTEIAHEARLIALADYDVHGAEAMYGFLAGICAGNYDVQEIYVDSIMKVLGEDADLAAFIQKIDVLAKKAETKVTLSVSMGEADVPAELKELVNVIA